MLRVKELLKERGTTAKELAANIGISEGALSLSLSGNPTLERLIAIATALDVPITDLFEKTGDFIAMVSAQGETRRFDSPCDLKRYIEPFCKDQESSIPDHENIRGKEYYK